MIYREPDPAMPLFNKHPVHRMHANSIAADRTVNHAGREAAVMEALRACGRPMTDREVCTALGSADMNFARPSITNLIDAGTLAEVDRGPCAVTGRTVRRVWFAEGGRVAIEGEVK